MLGMHFAKHRLYNRSKGQLLWKLTCEKGERSSWGPVPIVASHQTTMKDVAANARDSSFCSQGRTKLWKTIQPCKHLSNFYIPGLGRSPHFQASLMKKVIPAMKDQLQHPAVRKVITPG